MPLEADRRGCQEWLRIGVLKRFGVRKSKLISYCMIS